MSEQKLVPWTVRCGCRRSPHQDCAAPSHAYTIFADAQDEETEFQTGPLSVLTQSVKANTQARFLCL